MAYSLATINQMSQAEFEAAFGAVFEHTPAIATAAWASRPFQTLDQLHQAMVMAVTQLDPADQLSLIRAHPDLGSKVTMADASVQEQAGVGLDRLSAEEYQRFTTLNEAYKARFGFPFIVAVKGHSKASILAAFEQRLQHSASEELAQALSEIGKIAAFRLQALVSEPS
jgi:2-oxo-4-hydroxy-4-carboxy-5-ureidoimidazoline decarboxylase